MYVCNFHLSGWKPSVNVVKVKELGKKNLKMDSRELPTIRIHKERKSEGREEGAKKFESFIVEHIYIKKARGSSWWCLHGSIMADNVCYRLPRVSRRITERDDPTLKGQPWSIRLWRMRLKLSSEEEIPVKFSCSPRAPHACSNRNSNGQCACLSYMRGNLSDGPPIIYILRYTLTLGHAGYMQRLAHSYFVTEYYVVWIKISVEQLPFAIIKREYMTTFAIIRIY